MRTISIQTWALFVDAYRDLNSKKLFWITMGLSLLVVAVYAMFGLSEKGLTFLWFEWPFPLFNSDIFPPSLFYKFVFAELGVKIWLAWIATILAVVSTASFIPDFVSSGSIELTLSKPIMRARLFLTKYLTGLLFVGLQVAVFAGASFIVMGVRGGTWEWGVWKAVPIVVAFFSYLYCFGALVGILTRSTIAALIATLLFWFALFVLNTTETIFIRVREQTHITIVAREKLVTDRAAAAQRRLDKAKADGTEYVVATEGQDQLEVISPPLVLAKKELAESKESLVTWEKWCSYAYVTRLVLPKTSETVDLLSKSLVSLDDLKKLGFIEETEDEVNYDVETGKIAKGGERAREEAIQKRVVQVLRARGLWWTIGTSMIFQAALLGIAIVVFTRKEF